MNLLPLPSLLNLKRIAIGAAVVALAASLLGNWYQHEKRKQMEVVYKNREKTLMQAQTKREAPVVIVKREVVRVDGTRETETTETRGEVVTTTESAETERIVPLAQAMRSANANRWIVGAASFYRPADGFKFDAGYAGYGWGNRVDLLYGGGTRDGHYEHRALVLVRFGRS